MPAPELDILRRERDGSLIWMEAAKDMQAAKVRLEELVARRSWPSWPLAPRIPSVKICKYSVNPMGNSWI